MKWMRTMAVMLALSGGYAEAQTAAVEVTARPIRLSWQYPNPDEPGKAVVAFTIFVDDIDAMQSGSGINVGRQELPTEPGWFFGDVPALPLGQHTLTVRAGNALGLGPITDASTMTVTVIAVVEPGPPNSAVQHLRLEPTK